MTISWKYASHLNTVDPFHRQFYVFCLSNGFVYHKRQGIDKHLIGFLIHLDFMRWTRFFAITDDIGFLYKKPDGCSCLSPFKCIIFDLEIKIKGTLKIIYQSIRYMNHELSSDHELFITW
jgi:hypothetical protein